MAYSLPTYNLPVNIWRNGNGPPAPPDVVTVGNLTPGRRMIGPFQKYTAGASLPGNMYLLLPAGTDIRDEKGGTGNDLVEVPADSLRFYEVVFVDDIAMGFFNEHRFGQLVGLGPWPVPFPPATGPVEITGAITCTAPVFIALGIWYNTIQPVGTNILFQISAPPPIVSSYTFTVTGLGTGVVNAVALQGVCGVPMTGLMPVSGNGVHAFSSIVGPANDIWIDFMISGSLVDQNIVFKVTSP